MKDIFKNGYVSRIFTARAKRRRIIYIMFMLSVLAAVYVFWTLHRVGIAMTDEILCGKTEHVHSAECLSDINGCEIEEHTHTAECTSDISADIETEEVWTSTLPVSLSDNWRNNVAAIALSQIGYKESVRNFTLADNGEKKGYTRYGQWYGNPYGDWDTMFVYFCMFYAGIDTDNIPYGSGCSVWAETLAENGMFIPADIGKPLNGDVCFLDTDKDGTIDKTAVVTGSEETDPGFTIRTAEGDVNGEVAETSYLWDDGRIVGFLSLEQPDMISSGNNIEYSCSLPEDSEDISDDEYAEILPEEDEYILGISEPLTDDYAGYSAYMDNSVTYLANENERCVYLNGYLNGNYNPDSNGNTIIDIKSGQNVNIYVKLYLKKSDTDNSHPYNYYEQISEAVYNENKHKWNYFKHGENYYYFKAAIWNDTDDGTTTKFELYDSDYISYSSFYFQTEGSEEIIMLRQTVTGITLDAGSNSKRYLFKYNRCDSGVPTERFYIRVNPTKINITSPEQEANTYQEKGTPYLTARDNAITLCAVGDIKDTYDDADSFNQAKAANSDTNLQFIRASTGEYISTYARLENFGCRSDGSSFTGAGEDPRISVTYINHAIITVAGVKKVMITCAYRIVDITSADAQLGLSDKSVIRLYNTASGVAEEFWLEIMPSENINDGSAFNIKVPINAPCSNFGAGNPYGSDGNGFRFESRQSITLQCVTPYFEMITEDQYNELPGNKRNQYKKTTDKNDITKIKYIKTDANIWSYNVQPNANGELVDTLVTKGTVTYSVDIKDGKKLLFVDVVYTAKDVSGWADAKITYFSGISVNANNREKYYKEFYLRVTEMSRELNKYPIYVKTAGGAWKDKDMITEKMSWMPYENGYIPNSGENPYITYVESEPETHIDGFYTSSDMEYSKLELYFPRKYDTLKNGYFSVSGVSTDGLSFSFVNKFPDTDEKVLLGNMSALQSVRNIDGSEVNYRCYYINSNYLNNIYKDEITVKIDYCSVVGMKELPTENPGDTPKNEPVIEALGSIYVKLYPRGGKTQYKSEGDHLTHCDIEIEEGGLCSFEKTVTPYGKPKYKVIESYESVISGVKSCKVYDINGDPVKLAWYDSGGYRPDMYAEFDEDDYMNNGTAGSTQFEFTSAYLPEYGTEYRQRRDYFQKKDVYSVDFVVQVTLTPYKRTTIVYNDDGTVQSSKQDSFVGKQLTADYVTIHMDSKSVADALNKCPIHNGLDFTFTGDMKTLLNIDSTTTTNKEGKKVECEVKVAKKLIDGDTGELVNIDTIPNDAFQFKYTDLTTGEEFVYNKRKKDDSGTLGTEEGMSAIIHKPEYCVEGRYSFLISEIVPPDTKGIIYSDDEYRIDVIVKYQEEPIYDENNNLIGYSSRHFHCDYEYYDKDGNKKTRNDFGAANVPVFTNILTWYELPSTGGIGTIIYYVTGGVLIIVPIAVLIRRKRKER